jgi:hypothetical protein
MIGIFLVGKIMDWMLLALLSVPRFQVETVGCISLVAAVVWVPERCISWQA